MRADFYLELFAVNSQSFRLQIRLPNAFSVALRKADIMAVLFAFFIKIKSLHNSVDYFTEVDAQSQLN